jgi:hypothetical protein
MIIQKVKKRKKHEQKMQRNKLPMLALCYKPTEAKEIIWHTGKTWINHFSWMKANATHSVRLKFNHFMKKTLLCLKAYFSLYNKECRLTISVTTLCFKICIKCYSKWRKKISIKTSGNEWKHRKCVLTNIQTRLPPEFKVSALPPSKQKW